MANDFDVIVIGSGLAGHCAALEAAKAGARILVVDSESEVGGSSKLSTGMMMAAGTRFQRERGIDDDPALLYRHYVTANQWLVQPSVAHRLCYDAAETLEWMNDMGVEVIDVINAGEEDRARGHVTRGGAAIIEALSGHLDQFDNVDIATGTRVERLVQRGGAVVGIAVGDDEITAGAVIVATGGMAANHDLLEKWMPGVLDQANGPLYHQNTFWARGDAIAWAQQVGAQILSGLGSRAPAWAFGGGYAPGFVMVVNRLGRRFYNEYESYGASEVAFLNQPGTIGYMIFDEATKQAMQKPADVRPFFRVMLPETDFLLNNFTSIGLDDYVASGELLRADTIEELARMFSIPPANLAGAVTRYNQSADAGEDFDYLKPGHLLRPVRTPPFYGTVVKLPLLALTAIGMRTDHEACVIHENSLPINGLYAAGECVGGVLGSIYVGSGNSVANCAVYGRVAGRNAASYALESK
jgi:succinate dehydrogenase/fumarate reductase flavoprotein subunit